MKFQKYVPADRLKYVAMLIIQSFEELLQIKESRYIKEIQSKFARQILKLCEVDGQSKLEMFLFLQEPLGSKFIHSQDNNSLCVCVFVFSEYRTLL